MSKYCASIWELLKDKRVKIVFDSFEKARVHLEGKTIGIDAINQTVTEQGASWAVMRREFGKRVLALTLCGAKLVAFIDGEFASPGAGKTKKAGERAMAAGETLPPNTALPFYYRGKDWWSRDVLGEDDADGGYRGHRAALVVNCTDFGMPTAVINDGEAEGGLA